MENAQELIATRGVAYPPKPYFALVDGRLVARDYPLPPEPASARVKRQVRRFLHGHSALYRLFLTLRLPGEASAAEPPALAPSNAQLGVCLKTYPQEWRDAWRITRGLVLTLRREVEARGSRFAVVVINDRIEIADDYWHWTFSGNPTLDPADFDRDKPKRLITALLARRGIPAIALRDAFRERFGQTGTPGFSSWDGHWDVAGHELAADVIATAVGKERR